MTERRRLIGHHFIENAKTWSGEETGGQDGNHVARRMAGESQMHGLEIVEEIELDDRDGRERSSRLARAAVKVLCGSRAG